MPYKRIGNRIYHFKNNRWKVKQVCTTVPKAKTALRILKELEEKEK